MTEIHWWWIKEVGGSKAGASLRPDKDGETTLLLQWREWHSEPRTFPAHSDGMQGTGYQEGSCGPRLRWEIVP